MTKGQSMFTHKISERQARKTRDQLWNLKVEQDNALALRNGTWFYQRYAEPVGTW